MIHRSIFVLFAFLLVFFSGCIDDGPQNYRALPAPSIETPVVNPPLAIRQSNWLGGPGNREGSCAHASLLSMLHWQNQFELAKRWKATYGGGEYASRMRQRLDGFGVKYAYTENANLSLLDYAHETRRGALLWWKTAHCCTFVGWVEVNGKTYAAILDNNRVDHFELTERSEFHKRWAGYGGFALCVLGDPPSLPPFRSYKRIH